MKSILSVLVCIWITLAINTAGADTGTVTGRLLLADGKPLADGQVFFFAVESPLEKPVIGKFWRVPDAVEHVDGTGRFTIQLDPGSYYIGAIKRVFADKLGPPETGDYFLPVHDTRGNYRIIAVKNNSTTGIGTIKGIRRYSANLAVYEGTPTVIEGRIIKASGEPVKNMYVLAYIDSSMRGRPSFVSTPSDSEGRYQLRVDKGRTFYLKVRDIIAGGRPQAGKLVGVFGGLDEPAPVVTKNSSTTAEIDIQVDPFSGGGP
jgi:hypothetical protein